MEIDADERLATGRYVFDLDDIDTAIAELDSRYLAGEAGRPRARVVARRAGAFARDQQARTSPELTPDWVNIDHRRGAAFAPGDMTAFVHDLFEDKTPDINVYVEAVHRLSEALEWLSPKERMAPRKRDTRPSGGKSGFSMFEGDLLSRCELFDEADLDTALAQFEQLSPTAPQLENAASQSQPSASSRILGPATGTPIAEDRDRRLPHRRSPSGGGSSGVQHSRDAYIVDMRAVADPVEHET